MLINNIFLQLLKNPKKERTEKGEEMILMKKKQE